MVVEGGQTLHQGGNPPSGLLSYWCACADTCCSGNCHAATFELTKRDRQTQCQGGGTRKISKRGNTAADRVDHADNGGWRGPYLKGTLPSPLMKLLLDDQKSFLRAG